MSLPTHSSRERMAGMSLTPPWENEHYSFTGPGVAVSCQVDLVDGQWVATCELDITFTAESRHAAALGLFHLWMHPPEDDET